MSDNLKELRELVAGLQELKEESSRLDSSFEKGRASAFSCSIARLQALLAKAQSPAPEGGKPAMSESKGVCDYCHKPVIVRLSAGFSEAWHSKGNKVWHEVCSYQQEIERLKPAAPADADKRAEDVKFTQPAEAHSGDERVRASGQTIPFRI